MAIASPHPSLFVSLGIAALVMWRVYARVRRMVGRQKLTRWRPRLTVVAFPLLFVLLLAGALPHPINLAALIAGAALGSALGVYGHRKTKFEATPEGLYYTPNAHVGIALSLLFIGRVVYRVMQVSLLVGAGRSSPADFARSPITLAIFGMMAGYYVVYAVGLIRWAGRVSAVAPWRS